MGNKRDKIEIIAITAFVVAVVLFLGNYGRSHIVALDHARIEIVAKPHNAFDTWKNAGVNGRILLLFDRYLNAEPLPREVDHKHPELHLTPENYVYVALHKNILRKIYHIIPDQAWPEVVRTLSEYPIIKRKDDTFVMTIEEGVFIVISRARDLPEINEKVLISINGDHWDKGGIVSIMNFLKQKTVTSDLVTLSGPLREEAIALIREQYGRDQ